MDQLQKGNCENVLLIPSHIVCRSQWAAYYWSQIMMNENTRQHFGMVLATCRFISWLEVKDEDMQPTGSLKSCSNANIMELLFLRTLIKYDIIIASTAW